MVKEEHVEKGGEILANSGVKITTYGERHMGAEIGSEQCSLSHDLLCYLKCLNFLGPKILRD